jgi:hypothetical protein
VTAAGNDEDNDDAFTTTDEKDFFEANCCARADIMIVGIRNFGSEPYYPIVQPSSILF